MVAGNKLRLQKFYVLLRQLFLLVFPAPQELVRNIMRVCS